MSLFVRGSITHGYTVSDIHGSLNEPAQSTGQTTQGAGEQLPLGKAEAAEEGRGHACQLRLLLLCNVCFLNTNILYENAPARRLSERAVR